MSTFAGHTRGLLHLPVVRRVHLPKAPAWWREVALIAVLYVGYDVSRGLRDGNVATANHHGQSLLSAEAWIHIDVEHSLNQWLGHAPVFAVIASYFYATLHFIVTPAVLIWIYRKRPASYAHARTTLAMATVVGLVIFWLVPTTPPRLLPGSGFHDTMAGVSGWGWWGGEGSAPKGLGSLTNQLAAMPSLHVGWALWAGYLIFRHARRDWVRVLGALYPVLTALVVMSTANHYLLDVVAGAADVLFAAFVVHLVAARMRPKSQQNSVQQAGLS
jgi:hypothetical protein